jgi:IclR family acetate operon transcriptional repressor
VTDVDALMRELTDLRGKGYSVDDEEDAEGVICIGAPIVGDDGACAGAISVTGLKVDVPAWRLHQIGENVREHAEQVSSLLAGTQAVPA